MTVVVVADAPCDQCDAQPRARECVYCGARAVVTDCGHQSQPRPIAANERGEAVCDACVTRIAGYPPAPGPTERERELEILLERVLAVSSPDPWPTQIPPDLVADIRAALGA